MKRKISLTLPALLCAARLAGCSGSALDIFFPTPSPTATVEPTPSPTAEPTPTPEPTPEPLVPYEGEIRHIFFHSLIVYPEMVFADRETPMGGYNAGFSEKAELEKILPQLYERGYVLYDLNECYETVDGKMQRKEILLPAGKMPLILSVDDVAYAYGDGYARRLFVDDTGALLYEVPNPSGGVDIVLDGDVMGVVDAFVAEHPDFSWNGHKGTIALTGFQGAFGYPSYDDPACQAEIKKVADALRADGWSFASHSYTHNSGVYASGARAASPIKFITTSTSGSIACRRGSAKRIFSSRRSATARRARHCSMCSMPGSISTAPWTTMWSTSCTRITRFSRALRSAVTR